MEPPLHKARAPQGSAHGLPLHDAVTSPSGEANRHRPRETHDGNRRSRQAAEPWLRSKTVWTADSPWKAAQGGSAEGLPRSEEHTSELQSLRHLVCRLL